MKIQLSDHFSYQRLLKFTLPPIGMMLFTSIYSIVDGFFVSNEVGSTAFASLNLTWLYIMMISAIGFMFGTGGSALVAFYLGLQEKKKANEYFSMIMYTMIIVGIILSIISIYIAPKICLQLGATEEMLPYCLIYLKINMIGSVFFMLQNFFQSFLITAEKPRLGFIITVIAGCTNMILDYLFIHVLQLGLAGAALATITAMMVGGIIPFIYFIFPNSSTLRLTKAKLDLKVIGKACYNGVSEFLSTISASVVGLFYNLQLLHYIGENGVSAYGVICYLSFIFVAIFYGYAMGVAPIISYNYGAQNKNELVNVYQKSIRMINITNVILFILALVTSKYIVKIFVGYDQDLMELAIHGMKIYSITFLLSGFNIFASSLFTALNNGTISAIISVTRSLIVPMIMIFLLPLLFEVEGLWYVMVAVELITMIVSTYFSLTQNKNYHYLK